MNVFPHINWKKIVLLITKNSLQKFETVGFILMHVLFLKKETTHIMIPTLASFNKSIMHKDIISTGADV